jgi:hypothetical protein
VDYKVASLLVKHGGIQIIRSFPDARLSETTNGSWRHRGDIIELMLSWDNQAGTRGLVSVLLTNAQLDFLFISTF